ncbi:hypothetical protein [Collimonas arenae]
MSAGAEAAAGAAATLAGPALAAARAGVSPSWQPASSTTLTRATSPAPHW